jgi:hypothetical protein
LKLTATNVSRVPDLRNGEEFVIAAEGFSAVKITQLEKRCQFWKDMAPKVPL